MKELTWWLYSLEAWNGRAGFGIVSGCVIESGCEHIRLGCNVSGKGNRRSMELEGKTGTYKYIGNAFRTVSSPQFQRSGEGRYSVNENGQSYYCDLHKQVRRKQVQKAISGCKRVMGILSDTQDAGNSAISAGKGQYCSRLEFSLFERCRRMDVERRFVLGDRRKFGSVRGRFVCFMSKVS